MKLASAQGKRKKISFHRHPGIFILKIVKIHPNVNKDFPNESSELSQMYNYEQSSTGLQ